jgi:endonuclease/exonuclease/phosphatase family metal-dependent hydrolase
MIGSPIAEFRMEVWLVAKRKPKPEAWFKFAVVNLAGQDWMHFIEREYVAAHVFANMDCHIAAIQEVGPAKNLALLAKAKRESRFAANFDFVKGKRVKDGYTVAMAYDTDWFEVVDSGDFWLSPKNKNVKGWKDAMRPRASQWVEFRHKKTGKQFLVVNTHLDNVSPDARIGGTKINLEFIEEYTRDRPDLPVVLLGDFNMSVDSPFREKWQTPEMQEPYRLTTDIHGFTDCYKKIHPKREYMAEPPRRPNSYHAMKGDTYTGDEWGTWCVIYGFIRKARNQNIRVDEYIVVKDSIGGIWPSDHFWVVLRLVIF